MAKHRLQVVSGMLRVVLVAVALVVLSPTAVAPCHRDRFTCPFDLIEVPIDVGNHQATARLAVDAESYSSDGTYEAEPGASGHVDVEVTRRPGNLSAATANLTLEVESDDVEWTSPTTVGVAFDPMASPPTTVVFTFDIDEDAAEGREGITVTLTTPAGSGSGTLSFDVVDDGGSTPPPVVFGALGGLVVGGGLVALLRRPKPPVPPLGKS